MAAPAFERIRHSVVLAAPPERVFDFVTDASQWHRWHPATRSVRDVPQRPLVLGETMVEHIRAAHRSFEATWTVTACERPRRWQIETRTPLGASVVSYQFAPAGAGCRFERTCDFRSEGWWHLLDGNFTRWMLARQAQRALDNLAALFA